MGKQGALGSRRCDNCATATINARMWREQGWAALREQNQRQANMIGALLGRIETQQEELHRLRLALGHPAPALAALAFEEEVG